MPRRLFTVLAKKYMHTTQQAALPATTHARVLGRGCAGDLWGLCKPLLAADKMGEACACGRGARVHPVRGFVVPQDNKTHRNTHAQSTAREPIYVQVVEKANHQKPPHTPLPNAGCGGGGEAAPPAHKRTRTQ